jgi:hypothetical protein
MATLLLFVDGIGIGRDDPETNPFAAIDARRLGPLRGRPVQQPPAAAFRELDATLGVDGLPQSATGQTTLFTGVNAARVAGRHMQGLPGPTLHPVLERESLFLKLVQRGKRPTFANAYRGTSFNARRPRWSATTRMVLASGIPFRFLDREQAEDAALPHDYTGEWVRKGGWPAVERDAPAAARVLGRLLTDHDLVLYEYFLTDLVAHRGDLEQRREQARRVEWLIDAVLARVELDRHRVVLVSDHGNLEDGRDKRHTTNPVPLIAWGRDAEGLVARVERMTDLTPALIENP